MLGLKLNHVSKRGQRSLSHLPGVNDLLNVTGIQFIRKLAKIFYSNERFFGMKCNLVQLDDMKSKI